MHRTIDNEKLKDLLVSIQQTYGYDFSDYAQSSFKRRVNYFMDSSKINTLEDLSALILENEETFEEFVRDLSVTVTEMFRDPLFYLSLREKVFKRLATYPVVKIWIAGCATGEEVYSVAILLKEAGLLPRTIIYATDINQQSLQIAKDGIYNMESMQLYSKNYQLAGGKEVLSEYYKAKYNSVLFDKSLRENVVFAPHNLAVDKSFNEFQLIICRNVMIYFNANLQNKVINLFYGSLCSFGFLGLGSKESLLFSSQKDLFEEVDRKQKIYMKL